MEKFKLQESGLTPLTESEGIGIDGGFLPLLVIYGAWGVMAACSIVALGMREALNNHNQHH